MSTEDALKQKISEVITLCRELCFPYVIGYANTFDLEHRPHKMNVYGAGVKTKDLGVLLRTLHEAAEEHLGVEILEFTHEMSIENVEAAPKPQPVYDYCDLKGG